MSKFMLGADPELFLVDAAGAYVAACGLIGGTKREPQPLAIGPGFAVQEDNVTVEYNIPPAQSRDEFVHNIAKAMSHLTDMVHAKGLSFASTSAVVFPESELWHPASREFGCEPDYNAWRNGAVNPRPKARNVNLRTCGGHVHVGHDFATADDIFNFIKHADLFLGVPSVLMDEGETRKELYGKPGAFRFKPFGCEYRVLSNFWTLTPELTGWVWDATNAALDAWHNKAIDIDALGPVIIDTINKNNKVEAENLVRAYNIPMQYA